MNQTRNTHPQCECLTAFYLCPNVPTCKALLWPRHLQVGQWLPAGCTVPLCCRQLSWAASWVWHIFQPVAMFFSRQLLSQTDGSEQTERPFPRRASVALSISHSPEEFHSSKLVEMRGAAGSAMDSTAALVTCILHTKWPAGTVQHATAYCSLHGLTVHIHLFSNSAAAQQDHLPDCQPRLRCDWRHPGSR